MTDDAALFKRMSVSDQTNKVFKEIVDKQRAELDAKTARLRKLRLARDAERIPEPEPPVKRPTKRRL